MTVLGQASLLALIGAGTLVLLWYFVSSGLLTFQDSIESVAGLGRQRRARLLLAARVLELSYCCYITPFAMVGLGDLAFFTNWSWLVLTAYIALATAVSCSHALGSTGRSPALSPAPSLVSILADVSLGNALFLDLAYWVILEDGRTPTPEDFSTAVHGHTHLLNFVVALADRVLSGMRFSDYHFPFAILYMLLYATFSLIRWHIRGEVKYFFLDPRGPQSEMWLLALFLGSLLLHFTTGRLSNACVPYDARFHAGDSKASHTADQGGGRSSRGANPEAGILTELASAI